MSWGHTIPKEKPWPVKGIISVPRDPGWKDLSNPRRALTDAEIDKRIKRSEKK
jgi:hypothetical protein